MTELERQRHAQMLIRIAESVFLGQVKWVAISVQYERDVRIAYHTEGAPKRPQGVK